MSTNFTPFHFPDLDYYRYRTITIGWYIWDLTLLILEISDLMYI